MAEQMCRGGEIEQHHAGQRQRDNVVGDRTRRGADRGATVGGWHEFNDTWHSCHLRSLIEAYVISIGGVLKLMPASVHPLATIVATP